MNPLQGTAVRICARSAESCVATSWTHSSLSVAGAFGNAPRVGQRAPLLSWHGDLAAFGDVIDVYMNLQLE